MSMFSQAEFIASVGKLSELPPEGIPELVFAGRSNVGKSSAINALAGRKRLAFFSKTPGRTQTINFYDLGGQARLVDLPGYGFARGGAAELAGWGPMIEGYLTRRPALRRVYVLIDAKVGPTDLDRRMVVWLQAAHLPWRAVATKCDQVKPAQVFARKRDSAIALGLTANELGWVSSVERLGIDALRAEAAGLLGEV